MRYTASEKLEIIRLIETLRIGVHGLSTTEGSRLDCLACVHRHAGRGTVQPSDHPGESTLANGLYVAEGHWLGLVLSIDCAR